MIPPADTDGYTYHCYPGEIISHGVWLYSLFNLSYREVQERLFGRGIEVSHEAIRKMIVHISLEAYANTIRVSHVVVGCVG